MIWPWVCYKILGFVNRQARPRSGALRENGNRAVENGVLSGYGDGPVVPGGETARGQAAVMLARYGNDWNR